ncbi:hypothetical protein ACIPXV_02970 [Streptomyces libani]|uniref:hypothetical protein n=1 Tax=Streptomyces nigrescens TaxID=1920 RepID=UPI00381B1F09
MPDQPYTDDDLRAEAARQHAALTEDPEYMCVGEQMADHIVESTREDGAPRNWDSVLRLNADDYEQFEAAQRRVHALVAGAADVSEWAVDLGADGLEPTGYVLSVGAAERTIARIHFAFEPGMHDDMRTALVEGVGQAIADAL